MEGGERQRPATHCLFYKLDGCDREARFRGLCEKHYRRLRRMMERGQLDGKPITEKQFVAAGLLLPSRQGKRTEAFEALVGRRLLGEDTQRGE